MKNKIVLIFILSFILSGCFGNDKQMIDNNENQAIVWKEKVEEKWVWWKGDSWVFEIKNWFSK